MAIAERATDTPIPKYDSDGVFGLAVESLALPPGSVPVEPVRTAIRSYRAGIATAEQLIAAVDRHADALEGEIARRTVDDLQDFHRTINRLELLAGQISTRQAQLHWLKSFPSGTAQRSGPLMAPAGRGRHVEVTHLLAALRAVEFDARALQLAPHTQRLDGRRGRAPSMAALADAGVSATDVAFALGIGRRKAWAVLNGHERAPAELPQALGRLLGIDQAAVVLAAIPRHARARAPASAAVEALHEAGATVLDVAPLVPACPPTVRKWLRGTLRPSSQRAAALASALEQLVGTEAATRVVSLIPDRSRGRTPLPAASEMKASGC